MVPFNLEVELTGNPVIINAEQLDRLADDEGYIRYNVTEGIRCAVIYVNVEDQIMPLETVQDAEAYFEAVHYPEHLPAFCTEDDFTSNVIQMIANAIRHYNRKLRFMFNKFMNRSICPDL
jgi:hypothetical protein